MKYQTRHTRKRGCGYRKGGGLYMVTGGAVRECGLFPIPIERCPTCGGGLKQARSFAWFNPHPFLEGRTREQDDGTEVCVGPHPGHCAGCWGAWSNREGLLWIGAAYYDKPEDWLREAADMGVSRRISAVPTDFEIGEHWILAAHPKAIRVKCEDCQGQGEVEHYGARDEVVGRERCETCSGSGTIDRRPGLIAAFKPTAIEYVLTEAEKRILDGEPYLDGSTWKRLERLVKKGVTLVHDIPQKEESDVRS